MILTNKKIAIIESEGIIALDLRNVLAGLGAGIISTYLDILSFNNSLQHGQPDLIILDSQDSSTEYNIRNFTEKYNIPVIYLSDFPDESALFTGIRKCFYLRKPFEKKEIINILNKTA